MGFHTFVQKGWFFKRTLLCFDDLARGLDILQGNTFYGTSFMEHLPSSLENIIKKTKAVVPHLPPVTVGFFMQ